MIPRVSGDAVRAPFAMLPLGAASETRLLLAARGVRAVGDGFVSLLLPVYLLELGHGPFETGVIATATLAGSALLTLLVGLYAQRAMTRPGWFVLCLVLYDTSFALLGLSLKAIPVGVAYAIWSGAGAVLIALIGILWFHEAAAPLRLFFIAMIVIGAIGLNLTTRSH